MKAVCCIKKIPTVTHKLADILLPPESSVIIVAGANHVTYGKNPVESVHLENLMKLNTSSILLAKTMPTLIQSFAPNSKEFCALLKQSYSRHFPEVSLPQVALITEIVLS